MSAEFVDTDVSVYAHQGGAGVKHRMAVELLERPFEDQSGDISIQVLSEAEESVADLGSRTIHRPAHADLLRASRIHRQHKVSWWDALIINSALELGCAVPWSEDLAVGHRFGGLTIRNPFA